ncbi:MAG: glycosyl hydrolase family 28-related protein, partial [Bacteroidota bacterium]
MPLDRKVDWHLSGLQEASITPIQEINFLDAGGVADGKTPNDVLLQELLQLNADQPFTLYFPAGTYHFTQSVDLPSHCILRGRSADSTILQFDLSTEDHLLKAKGLANDNPSL